MLTARAVLRRGSFPARCGSRASARRARGRLGKPPQAERCWAGLGTLARTSGELLWPLHAEHLAMRHVPGMRQIHASTGVAQELPALGGRGGGRISSLTRSEQLHWQPSRRFIVATWPCRLIRAVLPAAYRYSATCQGNPTRAVPPALSGPAIPSQRDQVEPIGTCRRRRWCGPRLELAVERLPRVPVATVPVAIPQPTIVEDRERPPSAPRPRS